MPHSYGYVPDQHDPKDLIYQSVRPSMAPLPANVDLRQLCSPVRDQGNLGSCTGFAIAVGYREFLLKKLGVPFVQLSPLFLYYEERVLEHDVAQDAGAMPRDGFKVLAKIGCAPESDDPYDVAKFTKPPSAKAVKDAAQYKIAAYHRLLTLNDMRTCLAGGGCFVIGFKVYDSCESDAVAKTGKVPMPVLATEQLLGGHAVFCAGYRTDSAIAGGGAFIVKNSWGTGWGDGGYFYMPYAFATTHLITDAWTGMA